MSEDTTSAELISLRPRVRYRAVCDDGVLVHLETGRVIVVNEVGLRILDLLQKPIPKTDLAARITEEFDVMPDQAASDLEIFLDQLDAEQVIKPRTGGGKTDVSD